MDAVAQLNQVGELALQPDAFLVAAIRGEPPDEAALDALVDRYWKPLYSRCQILTQDHERARDLAQEAWRRLLRNRAFLKPEGNFPGYLMTIAANAWRDTQRSALRAGAMAENRLASIDAEICLDGGDVVVLSDVLPDPNAEDEDQTALKLDIDQALARLSPFLRDVLVARYLNGESCAEIGRRYRRTEQTVSAWVRAAVREVKTHFEEPVEK